MNLALVVLMLAQAAPADVPARAASGTLVDARGHGVAGAEVVVASELDVARMRRIFWLFGNYPESAVRREMPAVAVHGRSDAQGRFRIDLPKSYRETRFPDPLVVWVVDGGQLRLVQRLPRLVTSLDAPIAIDLGTARAAVVELYKPSGEMLAGARVSASIVSGNRVPPELAERFSATSDAGGRATLVGLNLAALDEVMVTSPRFGVQRLRVERTAERPFGAVHLAPVGSVSGRLVAEADLSGLEIVAETEVGGYSESGARGLAATTCDRDGNFSFGPIAAGRVALDVDWRTRPDLAFRAHPPTNLFVEAGQCARPSIELEPAVRVSGVVTDAGDDAPIGGARITISAFERYAISADDGTYWGYMRRELPQAYSFPRTFPLPFVLNEAPDIGFDRSPGAEEVTFKPIEVIRGTPLAGRVVDETGSGQAAWVEAQWMSVEGYAERSYARSDREGNFVLEAVHPKEALRIKARNQNGASGEVAVADRGKPILVTLERGKTLPPLIGRVVDARSRGIAGVRIEIETQAVVDENDDNAFVFERALWDGDEALVTAGDGSFRMAAASLPDFRYRFVARAGDHLPQASAWMIPTANSLDLGQVVLRRVINIDGNVVDLAGRGVAGATVQQSGDGPMVTRTTTAADGGFRLPGVLEGPAALLVSRRGSRTTGKLVAEEDEHTRIVLRGRDDPPAPPWKRNLASPLPPDEMRALIARLAQPIMARADDKTDGRAEAAWQMRIRLDGFAALEAAEKAGAADTAMKVFAIQHARAEDAERALEVIGTIAEPSQRATAYKLLAEGALRHQGASRRLEVLARAQPALAAMKDPNARVYQLAEVAGTMLNLGARDEARKLLAVERATIDKVGISVHGQGQCRLHYAKALARLDLPAALEIMGTSRLEDQEANGGKWQFVFSGFYGEIAAAVAADDPRGALRVLPLLRSDAERDEIIPRICQALARSDRAAAERLARAIPAARVYLRAWALGLIADTLVDSDRPAAELLLGEARGYLEYAAEDLLSEWGRGDDNLVAVACALAEIAERVDPPRVEEFWWRAIALRPARPGVTNDFYANRSLGALAAALSFYDRELARFVLGPSGRENLSGHSSQAADFEFADRVQAFALVDPRAAVALAELAPLDHQYARPDWDPRVRVFDVLGTPEEDRWRKYFCPLLRDPRDE